MYKQVLVALIVGMGMASGDGATGAEQVLKFRLVAHDVAANENETPSGAEQFIGSYDAAGVAIFDDGRVAFKKFVRIANGGGEPGDFLGYSVYTFQNGDSLTASLTGGWSPDDERGEYKVLSGTGAYANVTGTGQFVGVDAAWDNASMLEGSFTLDVRPIERPARGG